MKSLLKYIKSVSIFGLIVFVTTITPTTNVIAADEISISSCEELQLIGTGGSYPLDGNYILTGNIDCSEIVNFTPIKFLGGTFNGNGKTISNITINGIKDLGFFENLQSSTVLDLNISNININIESAVAGGVRNVGLLASQVSGSTNISNVNINGAININYTSNTDFIGGLVGYFNSGNINDSSVNADIYIVSTNGNINDVGGMIGRFVGGDINNPTVNSTININASKLSSNIGGLAGSFLEGDIINPVIDIEINSDIGQYTLIKLEVL